MEVTRTDIDRVAQIMDKDFSDAERTDVIQCLDCCDVKACPGSGKTTTMVAKLLILSEKIAGTMTGICALSHTNAAKNEINKSFGPHSGALMRYPHFVGTIQVFIDTFLLSLHISKNSAIDLLRLMMIYIKMLQKGITREFTEIHVSLLNSIQTMMAKNYFAIFHMGLQISVY